MKEVEKQVNKYKEALIKKTKKLGMFENFGQKEIRLLEDKYGAFVKEIADFEDWVYNYEG